MKPSNILVLKSEKMMVSERISPILQGLPAKPGCYLMKDKSGHVIYVGKAINLRNRVRSYYQPSANLGKKSLSELGEAVRNINREIVILRRLVDLTREVKDWKTLISDVDKLKEEYVLREVIDARIERLDEKIDNGLEALHTRIEDLKAIKFWSKRTLLEIALAIVATITSLYAAGILKF